MMNRRIYIALLITVLTITTYANANQDGSDGKSNILVSFDAGLLIGHNEAHYPAPFSSNITVFYVFNDWFWFGAGSGVQIIGKTFMPVYADVRLIPFKSKPLYFYNRSGATFCVNKNYTDGSVDQYYYGNYPHPLNDNVETRGGLINETGIGVMLQRDTWSTSFSLGYNYQQTKDIYETQNKYKRTYNYIFNRVAFRVGFIF
jgi:hypothetical protein